MSGKSIVCAAGVLAALMTGAACSPQPDPVPPASAPPSTPAAPSPSPTPVDSPSAKPPAQDLQAGPLRRTFRSGGLTFTVVYSTATPVAQWTATSPKTVQVTLNAKNNRQPRQKIYLTRANLRFAVRDASGDLVPPDPIVDPANLNPGYLITVPFSYEQSFAIPPLDPSAQSVDLEFKYEVVSLVDSKSKDYTKQTAGDSVRITLSA